MNTISDEYYVFIPEPGQTSGYYYSLGPAGAYSANTFACIPYHSPSDSKPQNYFHKILDKEYVSDLSAFISHKKPTSQKIKLNALTNHAQYLEKIKYLKTEIQLGNIYEINYCTSFSADTIVIDPVDIFLRLNAISKAPYGCLFKNGDDFIICASPELFLKKQGRIIYTKPIKGTIKRGESIDEDNTLKEELQNNLKERTENVMAVDVARNDLSKFAKKGTVSVNKLYNIETFETVHQMVSTVACEIKDSILESEPNILFETLIDATFPMASMTGAPKLRAMQLIQTCEDFERRGYAGAMGIIDQDNDFALSVIIRSIFYNQVTGRLSLAVGGAITYLSEPEKEYEECLLKARALLNALNAEII